MLVNVFLFISLQSNFLFDTSLPVLLLRCSPELTCGFVRATALGSLHHDVLTTSRKSCTDVKYSVIGYVHADISRVFQSSLPQRL
jgi:hypothetical protein